jgi:hypothetical protein
MLELQINDGQRRRHDADDNFLVYSGKTGGVVQMRWQNHPGYPGRRITA